MNFLIMTLLLYIDDKIVFVQDLYSLKWKVLNWEDDELNMILAV